MKAVDVWVGFRRARMFSQWLHPLFYRSDFDAAGEAVWQKVTLPAAERNVRESREDCCVSTRAERESGVAAAASKP